MKRILLLCLLLSVLLSVQAQELTVKSMEVAPMDLTASTQPRNDLNGNPCALVKVQLAMPDASFEGNVIGDSEFKKGEYWVYMSAGSYMLNIKHSSFVPLFVNFRDYNIKKVEGKTTYVLTLLMPQAVIAGDAAQPKVKFKEMAAKGEPLVPDWYSTTRANHWIGVSPPSYDGEKARSAAIVSALLLYLRSAETARMKYSLGLRSSDMETESLFSMDMSDLISYEGFVFEIADEYYNSRGEYFVDCAIMPDQVDNKLMLSRRLEYKEHKGTATSQNDNTSSGKVQIDLSLLLKKEIFKMSLECSTDEKKNDQYVLKVNDQRVIPVDDYSYNGYGESVRETGRETLVMTGDEVKSSLGLARLTALCVTPFVPRAADYKGKLMIRSEQVGDNYRTDNELNAIIKADTTYYPSPMSFRLIKNGGMAVTYTDVNFRDDDLNKNGVYHYGGWGTSSEADVTTLGQLIKTNVDIATFLNMGAYDQSQKKVNTQTTSQLSDDGSSDFFSSVSNNDIEMSLTDIGVRWAFPKELQTKKSDGRQERIMVKMRGTSKDQPVTMPEEEITIPEKGKVSPALAKAHAKEVKRKIKELTKEGWQPFYSDKPLEKQLENLYMLLSQYDDDGYPKYLSAEAQSIGVNNESLKLQSMELAKQSLVSQMQDEVSNSIIDKVRTHQLRESIEESLKLSMMSSYNMISQNLGKPKPMLEMYRQLPDGNKEVQVTIVCSWDMAKKAVKEALLKDLQQRGDKMYEKINQLF